MASAKKALKDGYASKFVFSLEASANRLSYNSLLPGYDYERRHEQRVSNHLNHIRVLQKNGKPLVGEDFTPLVSDLKLPDKKHLGFKTRTEIRADRK